MKCRVSEDELNHDLNQVDADDINDAFIKFLSASRDVKLEILVETVTEMPERDLLCLLTACEVGDWGLAGKTIIDALKDYAHDCATGGVLT